MLAPAPNSQPSLPLPAALLAAELGPVVMADDPCEAAFSGADPTGPRKYYRARYYDPKIGRFISEDPAGLRESPNLYLYASSNPGSWTDPTGLAVVTSGCETQQAKAIQEAAGKAEAAAKTCSACGLKDDWIKKIRNTTFHCPNVFEQVSMGYGLGDCARAGKPPGVFTGRDVMLFDQALTNQRSGELGGCGCLQGTILHEVAHLMLGRDESQARGVASSCFSCALKP